MHPDHTEYFKYMGAARLDKAVNTLHGILQGISMDSRIDQKEIILLQNWLSQNIEFRERHPINEISMLLESSMEGGYLEENERLDLIWVCEKLKSTKYYDSITVDIQTLHGLLAGIISDGIITKTEIKGLSEWVEDHSHLTGCWPYDEVSSLIMAILTDGTIDENEQRMLKSFFSEFIVDTGRRSVTEPMTAKGLSITGLCSVCPTITFSNSIFCFTGASHKHRRRDLHRMVVGLGGVVTDTVTQNLNYLVIGSGSNPCWAYACYGRKVEKAVELRKKGLKIILLHENDFMDSALDAGFTKL
jgi:hypothetical protein